MIRIVTILMLVLAGLPQVGIGAFDGAGFSAPCSSRCAPPIIHESVVEHSCCGDMASQEPLQLDMDEYCPMSGGQCTCGMAPDPQPTPTPKSPLQSSDSRITLGLTKVPSEVPQWMRSDLQSDHTLAQLTAGLVSLQSHQEKQARLGIWRT